MIDGQKVQMETVSEAKVYARKFMFRTFGMSTLASLVVATLYVLFSPSGDKPFHVIVILGAGGITIPMFICTMRLMIRSYYLSLLGWESTKRLLDGYDKLQETAVPIVEDIKQVVEKSRPIADNVSEIVERAKGMSSDVEKIANRVRSTAEALNGHLDLNRLIEELHGASKSLDVIAQAFTAPTGADNELIELKVSGEGRGRRRR